MMGDNLTYYLLLIGKEFIMPFTLTHKTLFKEIPSNAIIAADYKCE
jgi:hypothetical protein